MEDEIDEMRAEARKALSAKKIKIKQLLTTPELKFPVIIAVVCQVAQQWSGITAVSGSVYIKWTNNSAFVTNGKGALLSNFSRTMSQTQTDLPATPTVSMPPVTFEI